jgi:hypothetical protein
MFQGLPNIVYGPSKRGGFNAKLGTVAKLPLALINTILP